MTDPSNVGDPSAFFGPNSNNADDILATIPVTITADDLLSYPAKLEGDGGIQVSTRIPNHWLVQLDEIRERPGTVLPNFFPTYAAFMRWAWLQAFKLLQTIDQTINDPDYKFDDPLLSARIFAEGTAGKIAARAELINTLHGQVEQIAQAIAYQISLGEEVEAVRMLNEWLDGAAKQDPYWHRLLLKALVENEGMVGSLRNLDREGLITDELLLSMLEAAPATNSELLDGI